jgi:hypothetical protein
VYDRVHEVDQGNRSVNVSLVTDRGKECVVKKGIVFSVLFVLMALSTTYAQVGERSVLNTPEDYEGKTMVFEDAWLDGKLVHDSHFGFYCLDVDIHNKHVPGYLYRSQLNFVVFSEELAKELMADIQKGNKAIRKGHEVELLDRVCRERASRVRLTCIIERFQEYWIADVTKVELYGKQGEIIETLDAVTGVH